MDELRLKRLKYRSWHRGCKETDLILGQFSDMRLSELSGPEMDAYEQLLDENDADIWNWLVGKSAPDARYDAIIARLKEYSPR